MIDLNRTKSSRQEPGIGALIVIFLPFAFAFWMLIEWGL